MSRCSDGKVYSGIESSRCSRDAVVPVQSVHEMAGFQYYGRGCGRVGKPGWFERILKEGESARFRMTIPERHLELGISAQLAEARRHRHIRETLVLIRHGREAELGVILV